MSSQMKQQTSNWEYYDRINFKDERPKEEIIKEFLNIKDVLVTKEEASKINTKDCFDIEYFDDWYYD